MSVVSAKKHSRAHLRALATTSALTGFFQQMYRPGAAVVSPKKIIGLFNDAKISFVLMGAHGLGGWRSRPRATQDVDVLVAKRHHGRAVRVLQRAFPKLIVEDGVIVTRFKDPITGEPRIDLMKPLQKIYQMVFRHTRRVGDSHRVPDLEMALVSKFSAIVSPHRQPPRKIQDAADFADMVVHNKADINLAKLSKLAGQVYPEGQREISQLISDILAGRPIQV
ncbi:MAG: hypothetical protein ACJ8FY_16755 [Gemmataceae bacterium]